MPASGLIAQQGPKERVQNNMFFRILKKETAWFMANTNSTTSIQVYAVRLVITLLRAISLVHLESTWTLTLKFLAKLSDPRCLFMASVVLVNA